MKIKIVFFIAIFSLVLACDQTRQADDEQEQKEITLTDKEYKELEVLYNCSRKIYEYSKSQKDFQSYIENSDDTNLQDVVGSYHELKQAWGTIQELKKFQQSGNKLVAFTLKSETVQALKESAIGITKKLDPFLAKQIRDLNKKYLTKELIDYYEYLVQSGHTQYQERLGELYVQREANRILSKKKQENINAKKQKTKNYSAKVTEQRKRTERIRAAKKVDPPKNNRGGSQQRKKQNKW